MPPGNSPGLYGISEANSSRHGKNLWGKNQFNSTFPLSLCLLMRDKAGIAPVSVTARHGNIRATEEVRWLMSDVIGSKDDDPFYHFEEAFAPYASLSRNITDHIDLVVEVNGEHKIPLEIKLTVVPDEGTSRRTEDFWAPEIVMRPVTSAYAMMGVATSLAQHRAEARQILQHAYKRVDNWDTRADVTQYADHLCHALDETLQLAESLQKPFLVQPVWRTEGQSLVLCDQCFDVFVWSDVAITRIPVDQCLGASNLGANRCFREVARHVRALYDVLSQEDYNYRGIYKGMSFGVQTDKSFALAGKKTHSYLKHPRLRTPALPKDTMHEIILNDGANELKPERRFDSAVLAYHYANRGTYSKK